MAAIRVWNQTSGDQFGSNTESPTSVLPATYNMAQLDAPYLPSDVLLASRVGCSVSLMAQHNTSVPLSGWQAGGWAMYSAECFASDSGAWPDPNEPGVARAQNSGWLQPQYNVSGTSNELGGFVLSTINMSESRGRRNLGDIGDVLPTFRVSLSYGWPFFVESSPDQWTWSVSWYVRCLWLSQAGG